MSRKLRLVSKRPCTISLIAPQTSVWPIRHRRFRSWWCVCLLSDLAVGQLSMVLFISWLSHESCTPDVSRSILQPWECLVSNSCTSHVQPFSIWAQMVVGAMMPSQGSRGRVSFALLAKRLCEARYQIQEESCRSLEEAWDRGEEPPHQTLNVAPASWPCTWYVGTNTTVRPGRRRSPIPSGRNLWIHPGSPRKPMPWVSQHLWAETPFTVDINFSQSGCEATFLFRP